MQRETAKWREGKLFVRFLFSYLKNIKVEKSREKNQPKKISERESQSRMVQSFEDGQERMAN